MWKIYNSIKDYLVSFREKISKWLNKKYNEISPLIFAPDPKIRNPDSENFSRDLERHNEIAKTIRRILYALVGTDLFCIITLAGSKDSDWIREERTVRLPILDYPMSSEIFLTVGPIILIGLTIYMLIFIEEYFKDDFPAEYQLPMLTSFTGTSAKLAAVAIFYWMVPITLFGFAWKASPREWALFLGGCAFVFAATMIWLQIRRCPKEWRRRAVPLLLLIFASVVVVGIQYRDVRQWRNWSFYGDDLKGLKLEYGDKFANTDFRRAILSDARLIGVDLTTADFRNAILTKADFTDAILTNVDFTNAQLKAARFNKTSIESLLDPIAEIIETDDTRRDLSEVDLSEVDLRSTNLTNVDLSNADLTKTDLRSAILSNVNLTEANLSSAKLQSANLTESRNILTKANFRLANLSGLNLSGLDLREANLTEATLNNADFRRANLRGAKLARASLQFADLSGLNLSGLDLREADLTGATLNNADFREADLRGANLTGANLRFANLAGLDLSGFDLERTDLRRANLEKVTLAGANLRSANLAGLDLGGFNLEKADLRGADLEAVKLAGAKLRSANLAGLDLGGFDLSGTDLRGTDLSGVSLIGAQQLGQSQLRTACGNDQTKLPEDLEIDNCDQQSTIQ